MSNQFSKSTEIEQKPKESGIEVWHKWTRTLQSSLVSAESAARITAMKRGSAVYQTDQADKKWENLFSRVSEGMSKNVNTVAQG